jgi:hypothetical protein
VRLEEDHRKALQRRVGGWRAAEAREVELRRREGPLHPDEAFGFALEAWELNPEAFEAPDGEREREAAKAREAWAKLRERLPWQRANDRRR